MKPKSTHAIHQAPRSKAAKLRTASPDPVPAAFPIVGMGASAGGLEALSEFLKHLPLDSGLALVIIQHLDPTRPGMMADLLQRSTPLEVVQAADRQVVKPGRIYVIPPGKDISILRGSLFLFPPTAPRGQRLPINFFFESLAQEQGARAACVILSGMGSDGLLGAKAIKAKGGLVLVQDPATARSDGMPGSIIRAGIADVVAAPGVLADELVRSLNSQGRLAPTDPGVTEPERSAFEKVCVLLRNRSGHDFSLYKKSTLYRRIERRMGIHGVASIGAYVLYLQNNPQELDFLFKELLIGVTSFFRDPDAWQQLAEELLPALLEAKPEGGLLRAWVAGCSTGEESCSLAITFREVLQRLAPAVPYSLQIFATDLDADAIQKARLGVFPARAMAGLSKPRLAAWFAPEGKGFKLCKEIREMQVFAVQDVLQDPPFIHLDLLLCRNLLIYFTADLQKRLLPLFHYSLDPGGCLFLGSAESVGSDSSLFAVQPGKGRFFRKKPLDPSPSIAFLSRKTSLLREGSTQESDMTQTPANLQALLDQLLLQRFAPAAVLTSAAGDILYISGRTGKYLEPAMGKANWNIFAMAKDGLRSDLALAFRRAQGQKGPVLAKGLRVDADAGAPEVDLSVQALDSPEALRGLVLVAFSDPPAHAPAPGGKAARRSPASQARFAELEAELQSTKEELRILREEMLTSQEELRAANEEFQSTNEELQSTNEELMTSKEEMQSLNEELQTVNAEQQAKVEELSSMNNDMNNLLEATEIITLFLDEHLNVRRFTKGATRLFNLIPGDLGRPITDMVDRLDATDLASDANRVLGSLAPIEKEVSALGGAAWFSMRILPYRTLVNTIAGVVITFTEITQAKVLEAELRKAGAAGELHGRTGTGAPGPDKKAKQAD